MLRNTQLKKKKKYTNIQTTIANSWFSIFQTQLFPNVMRKFCFLHSKTYFSHAFLLIHFPINRHPGAYFKRLTAFSYIRWQSSKYVWWLSVSESRTDINCWRSDNECVYIHTMCSDITGETQIFILGAGICKCHMLFTITGINVNMTAEMSWC